MSANIPPPDNTVIGWVVAIGGGIGTAIIAAWKWFSSNKLSQAGVNAQLDVIAMLKTQLDSERNRADAMMKARDEAIETVNDLRGQIATLTLQVQRLEETVKATMPPSTSS